MASGFHFLLRKIDPGVKPGWQPLILMLLIVGTLSKVQRCLLCARDHMRHFRCIRRLSNYIYCNLQYEVYFILLPSTHRQIYVIQKLQFHVKALIHADVTHCDVSVLLSSIFCYLRNALNLNMNKCSIIIYPRKMFSLKVRSFSEVK